MKKRIALLLVCAMISAVAGCSKNDIVDTTAEDVALEEMHDTASTGSQSQDQNTGLTMDDGVFKITNGVLEKCYSPVTDMVIPDGVTAIGDNAFASASIKSITIPDNVTAIGSHSFAYSTIETVDLGKGVVNIGDGAFYSCDQLTSVNMSSSVITIGDSAFCMCDKLIDIDLPESVEFIGETAFYGCESLGSIEIPDGIKVIYENTFWDGYSCVTDVIYKGETYNYSFSGIQLIEDIRAVCNGLYIIDDAVWRCSNIASGDVVIPQNVTTINDNAFKGCYNIKSVTIPVGVTYIGKNAFEGTGILSISVPDSVTYIGSDAFVNCDGPDKTVTYKGVTYDYRNIGELYSLF